MSIPRFAVAAVVLGVACIAVLAFSVFLSTQTLSAAADWAQIVGFAVSSVLGVLTLIFAWLTWRGTSAGRSGNIRQQNTGGRNIASTGSVGRVRRAGDSGSISQKNSGGTNIASTGHMDSVD